MQRCVSDDAGVAWWVMGRRCTRLLLGHTAVDVVLQELVYGDGIDLGDAVAEQLEDGKAHELMGELPVAACRRGVRGERCERES